ncbi:hypothetical protein ACQKGO_08700 [Corallococcus interemptor]|uniref:hypothetical protein n=1 Tax=Corallococcus interemptor TaxID=2316720 RepID=UPI003D0042C6
MLRRPLALLILLASTTVSDPAPLYPLPFHYNDGLGLGLEVDRSWPLKREISQERDGGAHQRTTTVEDGPWRVVLGLTWYF